MLSRMSIGLFLLLLPALALAGTAGGEAEGAFSYDDFEEPSVCADCHVRFTVQHEAAMMHQSFTHDWDEIEYFQLALPHALKEEKVAGVKAGCNGCHAPLAYLAGDIPPSPPAEGTRANEGVSCEICHAITGFEGELPFNFNYVIEPGETKQGGRAGLESGYHEIAVNPFLQTTEFCGTCHNEKDPFDQWVKATQIEWKASPWAERGVLCQDCHMPRGETALADGETVYPDARQHLFHGAHFESKLRGAVELLLYPEATELGAGDTLRLEAMVMNAKAGHMIPSGSAEERVVWLHVEAVDAAGTVHALPVERKGFEGEDYTIARPEALAYQDIADIRGLEDFAGLSRDGDVPAGDRIYRLPYLDPQGRMTVAQWNTASFGPDYRLPPLEAVPETFLWILPEGLPKGALTITATVNYLRLVSSVAEYLEVPEDPDGPVVMAQASAVVQVN